MFSKLPKPIHSFQRCSLFVVSFLVCWYYQFGTVFALISLFGLIHHQTSTQEERVVQHQRDQHTWLQSLPRAARRHYLRTQPSSHPSLHTTVTYQNQEHPPPPSLLNGTKPKPKLKHKRKKKEKESETFVPLLVQEKSAYSVFNPHQEKLLGELDYKQWEASLRQGGVC
ncbi:hypothetical protein HMI54_004973 [Coelomomyces lativittatus]|nr:hypothetical protein HMI54_004973 [Coelomomyces lativittatus]KAJ1508685.1 hypothetical protein HMI56_007166 [Coelomomyces lativittatus]